MPSPFEEHEKILDFRFGLKAGFLAGAIFVLASCMLTRFHLLSFDWLIILACCWFFLWMINLNTQSGKTMAQAQLTAQSIIVFLGMLICFNPLQSLTLSIVSGFGFMMGCALGTFKNRRKNE